MLTSLEIENFKGIAARQRLEFAPLTLLFGANSAGKSTILQALLYLHELVERGSADVDRTELGGDVLELGGFARLVHKHDTKNAIVLRAEFDTPGSLERFGRDLANFPLPDVDDDIDSAWLELTIRWRTSATFEGPVIDRAVVGVNGHADPLVWIELGPSLREGDPIYARVNLGHPVIVGTTDEIPDHIYETTVGWDSISIPHQVLQQKQEAEGSGQGRRSPEEGTSTDASSAFSIFALKRSRLSALPDVGEPLTVISVDGDDAPGVIAATAQVRTFLEMVILGTTAQLAAALRESIYIGPLRAIPPRGFLYERAGRVASWAHGLAAWDMLLGDRARRVDEANQWLRRLGAGCQIVVQHLFDRGAEAEDISSDRVDKTVRRLLLDTGSGTLVLPSEVGAGISQVVPIIVAAAETRAGMTLIEQPELHIHPKLQTNLGDLFIVSSARRQFLIETHSEHLILRALRRIRETSAGELADGDPPFTSDKLSVVYVEATDDGTSFRQLHVDATGEFVERWPHGFFEERAKELF